MKHLLTICIAVLLLGSTANAATWNVPGDFATIQEAIDSTLVLDGDRIMVGPGQHAGAIVTKAVEIKGEGGPVINSGTLPWPTAPEPIKSFMAGFLFPGNGAGSGASISHLNFETIEFPVLSRGADNVTIDHCTMTNAIQGISNWQGSEWQISHNVITDLRTYNGGGIGILIGDRFAVEGGVNDNVVSHNKITGTLHVDPQDGGGYEGSGIVIYADFRWGFPGTQKMTNNRIVKNKISLVSDTPTVVDVVAVELSEHGSVDAGWPTDPPDPHAIHDNAIGFNDLRGTILQIALSPENLDEVNKISRNLGENRGHGLHPSVFGPDGN